MNIKDFLIDNYIYIIIVIVLIIITIIGFLADKKTKGRSTSKDILPNNNTNMGNVGGAPTMQQPMNYQPTVPVNETMGVMPNGPLVNNNVPVEPVNLGQVNNGFANPMNQEMVQEAPNTTENGLNVVPGMMQGTIISQNRVPPVEMAAPVSTMPQAVAPLPVTPEPVYQMPQEQPVMPAPVEPMAMPSFNQPMNMNNMQGVTPVNMTPVAEPINNMNSFGGVSSVQPVNPTPIPTPVAPTQPVNPIPPVPSTPVNPMPLPNQGAPNQGTMPQPVNNSQFNFVYGNQQPNQNNNGFMQ